MRYKTPILKKINNNEYHTEDGGVIKREYGDTPNGNKLNGAWVYRDKDGKMLDWDRYLNDLIDHYSFKVI